MSFSKINVFVILLDIIIKTGRYFSIISISMMGLNILFAANNFLTNNIVFGILSSLFAISGLIFHIQMHKKKKSQKYDFSSSCNKVKNTSMV